MTRIAPIRIATILSESSWMDRLDLTSPSTSDRDRAALMIAETIVARLDDPLIEPDADQFTLPIP